MIHSECGQIAQNTMKDIFLKLTSIKYSGQSIGENIRVEIESLAGLLTSENRIKRGTLKKVEKEIGKITTNKKAFDITVTIRVIEKDIIFNDIGNKNVKIKVDLSESNPQQTTHKVEVEEANGRKKKPKAVFEITLETSITDAIRYLEETKQGFLDVRDEDHKKQSLPAFLRIRYVHRKDGRDYFTILEGIYQGKTWSVEMKSSTSSYLLSKNPQTGPSHITFSISKRKLEVNGKSYSIKVHPLAPWSTGKWDIEIPDYPHGKARDYLPRASKALVWFHLGHDPKEERYIHTGEQTAGCITVEDVERWDELYSILIRARKGDSKSIGTVEVID